MLKVTLATLALVAAATPAYAVDIGDCVERNVTLNQVEALRPFANGSVKLFSINQEEPAAAPAGVAITIDRGDDLANAESFCRFVFGLSDVDVAKGKATFDQAKALLTIVLPVRSYDPETDEFRSGSLRLVIDKAAKSPDELVRAELR